MTPIKGDLTTEQALAILQATAGLALIKDPTVKIAGFRTAMGSEIALLRENSTPNLYLSPGSWEQITNPNWEIVRRYAPTKSRNHNLDANAPALATGNPTIQVNVTSADALRRLLAAYCDLPLPLAVAPQNPSVIEPTMNHKSPPLNQILYGPPGTGKTYATVDAALEILDPELLAANHDNRSALTARFRELCTLQRIRFVTFHQSFSYEDFVEGLRAEVDESSKQVSYEVVDGVFKALCRGAAATKAEGQQPSIDATTRTIWKMSLGNTYGSDAGVYDECLAGNYILLGYGDDIDFRGCRTRDDVIKRYDEHGQTFQDTPNDYKVKSVTSFVTEMQLGDLVVVSEGRFKFRAIGEVVGDYEFMRSSENDGYHQSRRVRWLRHYSPSLPFEELIDKQFSQVTLYRLKPPTLDLGKLSTLLGPSPDAPARATFKAGDGIGEYVVLHASNELLRLRKPNGNTLPIDMQSVSILATAVRSGKLTVDDIRRKEAVGKLPGAGLEPHLINGYNNVFAELVERLLESTPKDSTNIASQAASAARVLIIDEINRGNVSRIFGELITLLEPSKREGGPEALTALLPYSRESFSIPSNVHVIGTMNTADRSLTTIDIALRRRFVFREMAPRADLVDPIIIDGLSIGSLLRTLNARIEALLDRDHCLGHAYFLPLKEDPSIQNLARIFRTQILPLLQEYFFEDWQRIQWVLNDHRKAAVYRFLIAIDADVAALFGTDADVPKRPQCWEIQESAFGNIESYRKTLPEPPPP